MSDHLTKALQPLLFHRHSDFLLGHIPPTYSPVYSALVGSYSNTTIDVDKFTPHSFTTVHTATAARIYAPMKEDYADSPWLHILGHGVTIHCYDDSLDLYSSHNHTLDCGGVLP